MKTSMECPWWVMPVGLTADTTEVVEVVGAGYVDGGPLGSGAGAHEHPPPYVEER
jgi:hypothetical protein